MTPGERGTLNRHSGNLNKLPLESEKPPLASDPPPTPPPPPIAAVAGISGIATPPVSPNCLHGGSLEVTNDEVTKSRPGMADKQQQQQEEPSGGDPIPQDQLHFGQATYQMAKKTQEVNAAVFEEARKQQALKAHQKVLMKRAEASSSGGGSTEQQREQPRRH